MNASDKNGSLEITDSIFNDGFEIDFDSKNSSINHDLKSAYDQLYKEIKYTTDLTIREILNESNLKIMKIQHDFEQKLQEAKMKQWCINCGKEAVYYCCKNTSYCNETCQHQHWSKHYKSCSRVKMDKNDLEADENMD